MIVHGHNGLKISTNKYFTHTSTIHVEGNFVVEVIDVWIASGQELLEVMQQRDRLVRRLDLV